MLPLQNLSGDPQQEYFADGMVEEIITTLSRLAFMGRAWDRSGWLNRLQAAADGILAATVPNADLVDDMRIAAGPVPK